MTAKEKILDRIVKLLSLSKSSNQHEAATAAAMAAELMLEHQISEAELTFTNSEPTIFDTVIDKDGKTVEWKRLLVHGLAVAFGCRHYLYRAQPKYGIKAKYCVIGTKESIDTITYMYRYLSGVIDRLAKEAWNNPTIPKRYGSTAKSWKGAFRAGAAAEVFYRLERQRAESMVKAKQEGKSNALIVLDNQKEAIDRYADEHHNIRSEPASKAGRNSDGYWRGRHAGKELNLGINKGLNKPAQVLEG